MAKSKADHSIGALRRYLESVGDDSLFLIYDLINEEHRLVTQEEIQDYRPCVLVTFTPRD